MTRSGQAAVRLMRRRPRRTVMITLGAVVVAAGILAWGHQTAGSDGPLEGTSGMDVTLPVDAAGGPVVWGVLVIANPGDRQITIESARLLPYERASALDGPIVLWGPERVPQAGAGALVAYQTPLPAQWRAVVDTPLSGYVLRPNANLYPDGGVAGVEVVARLRADRAPVEFEGVELTYSVGGKRYVESFANRLSLCARVAADADCA